MYNIIYIAGIYWIPEAVSWSKRVSEVWASANCWCKQSTNIWNKTSFVLVQYISSQTWCIYYERVDIHFAIMCTISAKEAAALMIQDIDIPSNQITGEVLLEDSLPRFVYVNIRRSKTDQDGQGSNWDHQLLFVQRTGIIIVLLLLGQRLLLRRNIGNYKLCPVLTLMSWLAVLR